MTQWFADLARPQQQENQESIFLACKLDISCTRSNCEIEIMKGHFHMNEFHSSLFPV